MKPAETSLMISCISAQAGWNSVPHSTVNDSALDSAGLTKWRL